MKTVIYIGLLIITTVHFVSAQNNVPVKLKHAEPLSVDLIRDLGARKGEKEFNIGLATVAQTAHNVYSGFIEYEFAPLNRLGMEIEVPFLIQRREVSENIYTIKAMKLAVQYTFYVNQPVYTSAAVGYIHELKFSPDGVSSAVHPLFIIAKCWAQSFHTMAYISPVCSLTPSWQCAALELNTSVHYMKSDGKGFVGIEFNQQIENGNYKVMFRPQVKAKLSPALSIGLCAGFPLSAHAGNPDMQIRIIYEP